ncbi:MAG: hypothetical protein R3F11_11750 [Verrucomicrobiales bacterium]
MPGWDNDSSVGATARNPRPSVVSPLCPIHAGAADPVAQMAKSNPVVAPLSPVARSGSTRTTRSPSRTEIRGRAAAPQRDPPGAAAVPGNRS